MDVDVDVDGFLGSLGSVEYLRWGQFFCATTPRRTKHTPSHFHQLSTLSTSHFFFFSCHLCMGSVFNGGPAAVDQTTRHALHSNLSQYSSQGFQWAAYITCVFSFFFFVHNLWLRKNTRPPTGDSRLYSSLIQ